MGEPEPTVFILDEDIQVQRILRGLMESVRLRSEFYTTTQAFMEKHDPSRPGCLIVEVRVRDMSGIELYRRLRREGDKIPVIFLTKHGDISMAVQAMREGAFHFLQKPCNDQYLLDQTHAAIALDLERRREDAERRMAKARFEGLSARECDVLMEIIAGKTNKEMARRFGVVVKTVEFHRANIMKKVGIETVPELVRLLFKSGWDGQMHQIPGG